MYNGHSLVCINYRLLQRIQKKLNAPACSDSERSVPVMSEALLRLSLMSAKQWAFYLIKMMKESNQGGFHDKGGEMEFPCNCSGLGLKNLQNNSYKHQSGRVGKNEKANISMIFLL